MAKDKLHAHIVLDRSGSMEGRATNVIDSVNEYVKALASDDDIDARISLTLFDSPSFGDPAIDLIADNVKVKEFKKLDKATYVPRGGTPLNDAIGKVVADMSAAKLRAGERVAIVILTDGLENRSVEYTTEKIKALLDRKKAEDNWLVIYLGANQDAFAEGNKRGINTDTALNFHESSYKATLGASAQSTLRYAKSGDLKTAAFTDQERSKAIGK